MFESLSAKMDKDKEERMQAQPQRFDRRDDSRRDDRGYPRKNAPNFERQGGRGGNSSYSNSYANQRSGGNREYPAGSGQRNCHICGLPGHPFMRCPHFHDPKYAEQKELAFKKIRRGVNHIERDHDTREADSVRELFDPLGQQDDMSILHIALDTLDYLEDEMIGAGAKAAKIDSSEHRLVCVRRRQKMQHSLITSDHCRYQHRLKGGTVTALPLQTVTATACQW